MIEHKELGRISEAWFGYGGYQDAMLGFGLVLEGESWGYGGEFYGTWASPPGSHAEWTEDDQTRLWGEAARKVRDLLRTARVDRIQKLVGMPIEATFDGNRFVSFRILTEVMA
jgi:hypothetical protein